MFTAPIRIFLASFLVLFLEVALIRWLPAQIRLLSYFSNFILLASFLGIGIGANTAIYSAVDALLLRSLRVRDPGCRESMVQKCGDDGAAPSPETRAVQA